jgi:Fic family protein
MRWNWELSNWPKFQYNADAIVSLEKKFLMAVGSAFVFLKNVEKQEYNQFIVEVLSQEGIESAKIEGELLDRESLQSSIKKQFGIQNDGKRQPPKELGMAELLCDVYGSFAKPLTHEMLWDWHKKLFRDQSQLTDLGTYRTHPEPMQIVSGRYDRTEVFFEAPPSSRVLDEMNTFIDWYNTSLSSEPILGRAAIAHVYFESIHPFEDGNGRIGRVLIEKMLSQNIGKPVLIAISKVLEKRKKEYYKALEACNRTLDVQHWVTFFVDAVLQAQEDSLQLLSFLIKKSRILTELAGQLNPRQEKALLRMFAEGFEGFKGGLSAEKYIAITKASRATATRDLVDLVKMGALVKTGELRHTRYWLNLESESL